MKSLLKFILLIDTSDAENHINPAHVTRVKVSGGTIGKLRVVLVELVSGSVIEVLAAGKSDGEAIHNTIALINSLAGAEETPGDLLAETAAAARQILSRITKTKIEDLTADKVRELAKKLEHQLLPKNTATLLRYADDMDEEGTQ